MGNNPAPPESTAVSIDYANPAHLPIRPRLLTALGVTNFVVAAFSILVNLVAIALCIFVYRLTLPPPTAGPILPVAPSSSITPYHGELSAGRWIAAGFPVAIVAAATRSQPLNHDRQAMLNRLLAECGKQICGSLSTNDIAAAITHSSGVTEQSGSQTITVFNFPTGQIRIDNIHASFQPADGSAVTDVAGNRVHQNGKSQYCAVAIDEAVDAAQQYLKGGMNALQAGALADLYRDDADLPPNILATADLSGVGMVDRSQTVLVNTRGSSAWIVSTGGVVMNPGSSPGTLDPQTGLPPAPPPGPARRPLTLDASIIIASALEYLCSAAVAILLIIAGVRVTRNAGDAPRLHGAYSILKIGLAILNCVIGMQVMQQLVDGGFLPDVSWAKLIFGLIVQVSYPVTIAIVFAQDSVRSFYRRRGLEGSLIPISWLNLAAEFSPDAWRRLPSTIAAIFGMVILLADFYLWSHKSIFPVSRSFLFFTSTVSGLFLLVAGVAGRLRSAAVTLAVLLGVMAQLSPSARADEQDVTTPQILDRACEASAADKGPLFRKLETRDDAFLPMSRVAVDAQDPYNQTLAKITLKAWIQKHSKPDSREAQAAIDAAIKTWLAKIHSAGLGNREDSDLVDTLCDTSQIVRLVQPWLDEGPIVSGAALDLIANAKPDDDLKWNTLVQAVANPATGGFAAQMLRRYRAPDYESRLASMAKTDPLPGSRITALRELQNNYVSLLSPFAESVVTACTEDPDVQVRSEAMIILCRSVRGGEIKMIALLRSPRLDQRQSAARALALNPFHQGILAPIVSALHDPDAAVRAAALVACQRNDPLKLRPSDVDELLALMEDPDPQVRFQAECVITYSAPDALGPYSSRLFWAALHEGSNSHREQGILTDATASPLAPLADNAVPTYPDADPLTGQAIPAATMSSIASTPVLLALLARCVCGLACLALLCLITGIFAKAWRERIAEAT